MRDKFSIYVPRNDSNQSPTHLGGFSQLWMKRPPAKSINVLASARDIDRFESLIKRISFRRREKGDNVCARMHQKFP